MKPASQLLLFFGLVVCSSSLLGATDLQVADALEGLRHNAALLRDPYVRWTCVKTRWQRPEGRQGEAKRAEAQEVQLGQTLQHRSDYEMWMKGSAVHLRSPQTELPVGAPLGSWRSPSGDVEPTRLVTDFPRVLISTLNPTRAPQMKRWTGLDESGRPSGLTEPVSAVEELVSSFLYPPFTTPPASVGSAYQCDDAISWLLSVPESELAIVREETLDGVRLAVVQHLKKYPAKAFGGAVYPGKIELGDITTVWVDVDRSSLPIKMERRTEWFYNGTQVGEREHAASVTIAFEDVVQLPCGAFYPRIVTRRFYMADPDCDGYAPVEDPLRVIAGRVPYFPIVLRSEDKVAVGSIEPGCAISDSMLSLQFPEGTIYRDGLTRKVMIQGVADENKRGQNF